MIQSNPDRASTDLPLKIHSGHGLVQAWLDRFDGRPPLLACVLGFTATALIPGISAAGATPNDRRYTALADGEFLYYGLDPRPQGPQSPQSQGAPSYPLPPLQAGISPAVITHALVKQLQWPLSIFDAGLPESPPFPVIELPGQPAQCLSSGQALNRQQVQQLWRVGLNWGDRLADRAAGGYVVVGECVVGGTTTALALLTGLGVQAQGKVNSSHPSCNHGQKQSLVMRGLNQANLIPEINAQAMTKVPEITTLDPLRVVAAVGDPMQIAVAGMALGASRRVGVLLAGGTQMLAVYSLMVALGQFYHVAWRPQAVVVGTTRWVMEDVSCDGLGLIGAIADRFGPRFTPGLITTQLNFQNSRHAQLRAYEQGFVKEGVALGGSAIAASVSAHWHQADLLAVIDGFVDRYGDWYASWHSAKS